MLRVGSQVIATIALLSVHRSAPITCTACRIGGEGRAILAIAGFVRFISLLGRLFSVAVRRTLETSRREGGGRTTLASACGTDPGGRTRAQNIWPIEKCHRTPVFPKLRGTPRSMRIGARGV